MAKPKQAEPKQVLEREYIVPLRKGWLKVPKYKRTNKAVKTLKEFIARHMKIYDDDLRKIKIDMILNNELRFRGMKKPPAKIKVKAMKFDNNIVRVSLVNIPAHIKFAKLREEKKKVKIEEKVKEKEEARKAMEEAQKKEEEKEKSEKEAKEEKKDGDKKDIKKEEKEDKESKQQKINEEMKKKDLKK